MISHQIIHDAISYLSPPPKSERSALWPVLSAKRVINKDVLLSSTRKNPVCVAVCSTLQLFLTRLNRHAEFLDSREKSLSLSLHTSKHQV